jgi:hypothetical protein
MSSGRKRKGSFGSDKGGTKASKVKEEQQEQIPTSLQDEFRSVKMFTDLLSLSQLNQKTYFPFDFHRCQL